MLSGNGITCFILMIDFRGIPQVATLISFEVQMKTISEQIAISQETQMAGDGRQVSFIFSLILNTHLGLSSC